MTCANGRINPSSITKLRLFADSGGYCSNPACLTEIFLCLGDGAIHIGEIAHVISAGDNGPRTNAELTPEERSRYDNLILLCPTCHTVVDKAEQHYPLELLLDWKNNHKRTIAEVFGTREYRSREEVRKAIEPLLDENHFIFQKYGPLTDERFNPESEMPRQWLRKIRTKIIPNNRRILALCEVNRCYLSDNERNLLLAFSQHLDDFEAKHLNGAEDNGQRFPDGFGSIFK